MWGEEHSENMDPYEAVVIKRRAKHVPDKRAFWTW